MKKQLFMVSFCYRGLLGGEIIADENAVTYRTGKLTIPAEYRNLEMKYTDIAYVYRDKAAFLPAVSILQLQDPSVPHIQLFPHELRAVHIHGSASYVYLRLFHVCIPAVPYECYVGKELLPVKRDIRI